MKRIDTLLPREVLRRTGHIALGLFEGGKASSTLTAIHPGLLAFTQAIIKKEQFKAQAGKSLSFYFKSGRTLVKILILGLGKGADFGIEKAREAAGLIAGSAAAQKAKQVGFLVDSFLTEKTQKEISKLSEAIAEAVELACYRFKNYKVSKNGQAQNHFTPEKIFLVSVNRNHLSEIRSGINCGLALASGVTIARDLINEPSNKMNPQIFSERARGLARKFGLKFHVLEKKDLRKEKMGALLAVGQGSVIPPRMVVLSYEGRKSSSPICLVGKGITFDTGGISIKPSKDMEKMKYDMSGGAAVLGILISAASLKLPVKLVGLVPLAENMPSGSAVKPGDVVHSAAGLSIEVINTDAEGRLVLADALHYAKRFKPKAVFDIATLTGAVNVVLGSRAMAAMGDSPLIQRLQKAGEEVNERVWPLPMWSEYDEDVKSEVADLQNVGKGEAGTIMGAKFLEPFVAKSYPWVHLDIASTAWVERKAPSYCPKGARGVAIRLLIQYLRYHLN